MKQTETIDFVSSANKLKGFTQSSKKMSYKERKNAGIEIIRTLAINKMYLSTWIDFFNKHTKKDDLADCFLQGLWYLKEKGLYLE